MNFRTVYDEQIQRVINDSVVDQHNIKFPVGLDPRDVEQFLKMAHEYQDKLTFQYLAMDSKLSFCKFLKEEAPEMTDYKEVESSRVEYESKRKEYTERLSFVESEKKETLDIGLKLVTQLDNLEKCKVEQTNLTSEMQVLQAELKEMEQQVSLDVAEDDTLYEVIGKVDNINDVTSIINSSENLQSLNKQRDQQILEVEGKLRTNTSLLSEKRTNLATLQGHLEDTEAEKERLAAELRERMEMREKLFGNANDQDDSEDGTNAKVRKMELTTEWYSTMYAFWTKISGVEGLELKKTGREIVVDVKYAKFNHNVRYLLSLDYKILRIEGYDSPGLEKWISSSRRHEGLDGLSYVSRRIMYD